MTFDERLEQTLVEWGQACYHKWGGELQKKKAITAIKQAMRETMPEKEIPSGAKEHFDETSPFDGYGLGYNTAISDVEKGFGL